MLLGVLGYKPWELHKISYRDVDLAISGLYEQNKFNHDLLGKAVSFICAGSQNGKQILKTFQRDWYGEKKGKKRISKRVMDQLYELRKINAIKSAKEKIDARGSQTSS